MIDLVNQLPMTTSAAHQAWPIKVESFITVNWFAVQPASFDVQSANDNFYED